MPELNKTNPIKLKLYNPEDLVAAQKYVASGKLTPDQESVLQKNIDFTISKTTPPPRQGVVESITDPASEMASGIGRMFSNEPSAIIQSDKFSFNPNPAMVGAAKLGWNAVNLFGKALSDWYRTERVDPAYAEGKGDQVKGREILADVIEAVGPTALVKGPKAILGAAKIAGKTVPMAGAGKALELPYDMASGTKSVLREKFATMGKNLQSGFQSGSGLSDESFEAMSKAKGADGRSDVVKGLRENVGQSDAIANDLEKIVVRPNKENPEEYQAYLEKYFPEELEMNRYIDKMAKTKIGTSTDGLGSTDVIGKVKLNKTLQTIDDLLNSNVKIAKSERDKLIEIREAIIDQKPLNTISFKSVKTGEVKDPDLYTPGTPTTTIPAIPETKPSFTTEWSDYGQSGRPEQIIPGTPKGVMVGKTTELKQSSPVIRPAGKSTPKLEMDIGELYRSRQYIDENTMFDGKNVSETMNTYLQKIGKAMNDDMDNFARKTGNEGFILARKKYAKKLETIGDMKLQWNSNTEKFIEQMYSGSGKSKVRQATEQFDKIFGTSIKDRAFKANMSRKFKQSDFRDIPGTDRTRFSGTIQQSKLTNEESNPFTAIPRFAGKVLGWTPETYIKFNNFVQKRPIKNVADYSAAMMYMGVQPAKALEVLARYGEDLGIMPDPSESDATQR